MVRELRLPLRRLISSPLPASPSLDPLGPGICRDSAEPGESPFSGADERAAGGEAAAGGVAARVRWLAAPSGAAWLAQALADPDLVLLDHAHCERKAAGAALQLMFRYPGDGALAAVLSPLARRSWSISSGFRPCWRDAAFPCAPWRLPPMARPSPPW